MTENLRLTLTEGKAIEISDGSMWLPTNYDGSTTNSTTLTVADYDDLLTIWGFTSNGRSGVEVVRSIDTWGFGGQNKCNYSEYSGKVRLNEPCYNTALTNDGEIQKIGVTYNWYTATAGQGTLTRMTSTDISICPKNWQLPSAITSTPSYLNLFLMTYNITNNSDESGAKVSSFPFSSVSGGEYIVDTAATFANQRRYGRYSTSEPKADSDIDMRFLSTNGGSSLNFYATTRKRASQSVRCVISGN